MKRIATLTILLLFLITGLQAQIVTINRDSADAIAILKEISAQAKMDYTFMPVVLSKAKKVSMHITNAPFIKALELLCKDQPFSFRINETLTIVLVAKDTLAISKTKRINFWGTVLDESNEPVSNVLAVNEETGRSGLSNNYGLFYLPKVPSYTLVRLTSDEIEPYSFYLTDQRSLSIHVKQKSSTLPTVEVIHTGYPQVTKPSFTGSSVTLSQVEIKQRSSAYLKDNLEGLVPSLLLVRNKIAGINQATNFTLGPRATVFANPDPLIVVDNFPFEGDIADINMDDVEDITVLRDAAASAIWGARAGNGVIVITTKSGKFNKPLKISFNTYFSIGNKPDVFYQDRMSPADHVTIDSFLVKNGYYRRLINNPTHPALPPVADAFYANAMTDDVLNNYRALDVRKDMQRLFYRNSFSQHLTAQVSGGDKVYAYLMSVGYDNALPELQQSRESRFNFVLNNSFRPLPGLELSGTLSETYGRQYNIDGVPVTPVSYSNLVDTNGRPVPQYYLRSKTFVDTAGYDASGTPRFLDWKYYPATEFNLRNRTYTNKDTRIQGSIRYHNFPAFLHGLEAAIYGQYQVTGSQLDDIKDKNSFFVRDLVNSYTQVYGSQIYQPIPWGNILDSYISQEATLNMRYVLTYNKKWSNLNSLHLMAGRDRITSTGNFWRNYIYNYSTGNTAGQNNLDYASLFAQYYFPESKNYIPNNVTSKKTANNYYSYYASGNFGLKNRYIFSGSIRLDKSNLYGAAIRLRNLPLFSVGMLYNLSLEKWYKFHLLQDLKLRASFGTTGNSPQNISAYQTIKSAGANEYGDLTSLIYNPPLPSLRWEKVYVLNFGIQFQAIHKIIEGSIDWYHKASRDLVGNYTPDPTSGIAAYSKNIASMASRNVDVVLTSNNINRLLRWRTKLLLTYVKDYVTHTEDALQQAWIYADQTHLTTVPKRPLYAVFSFPYGGLDFQGQPITPNKDREYGAVTMANGYSSMIYNGRSTPAVFGSITNEFTWKQFNLSASVFYKLGYYFRKPSVFYTGIFDGTSEGSKDFDHRWQKADDEKNTKVPQLIYPANANRDYYYIYSDALIRRADNIRLQNIQLSYDIKENALKKLRLKTANIYCNWSNPCIIWKANKDNIDPDHLTGFREPSILTIGLRGAFK